MDTAARVRATTLVRSAGVFGALLLTEEGGALGACSVLRADGVHAKHIITTVDWAHGQCRDTFVVDERSGTYTARRHHLTLQLCPLGNVCQLHMALAVTTRLPGDMCRLIATDFLGEPYVPPHVVQARRQAAAVVCTPDIAQAWRRHWVRGDAFVRRLADHRCRYRLQTFAPVSMVAAMGPGRAAMSRALIDPRHRHPDIGTVLPWTHVLDRVLQPSRRTSVDARWWQSVPVRRRARIWGRFYREPHNGRLGTFRPTVRPV